MEGEIPQELGRVLRVLQDDLLDGAQGVIEEVGLHLAGGVVDAAHAQLLLQLLHLQLLALLLRHVVHHAEGVDIPGGVVLIEIEHLPAGPLAPPDTSDGKAHRSPSHPLLEALDEVLPVADLGVFLRVAHHAGLLAPLFQLAVGQMLLLGRLGDGGAVRRGGQMGGELQHLVPGQVRLQIAGRGGQDGLHVVLLLLIEGRQLIVVGLVEAHRCVDVAHADEERGPVVDGVHDRLQLVIRGDPVQQHPVDEGILLFVGEGLEHRILGEHGAHILPVGGEDRPLGVDAEGFEEVVPPLLYLQLAEGFAFVVAAVGGGLRIHHIDALIVLKKRQQNGVQGAVLQLLALFLVHYSFLPLSEKLPLWMLPGCFVVLQRITFVLVMQNLRPDRNRDASFVRFAAAGSWDV